MYTKYKSLFFFLLFVTFNAQVGINTTSPKSTLDVNGTITLRNELRVGGTKTTTGNPGTANQILVSQGDNVAPVWKTSKLGFYEVDEYRITQSDAKINETGINFSNTVVSPVYQTSDINDPFAGASGATPKPAWSELPMKANSAASATATTFKIDNPVNKVDFVFQTAVEMSNTGAATDQFVRYACGIFIDNQLKAVRADQINGVVGKGQKNQAIFTLKYVVENLPVKPLVNGVRPTYDVKVGCRRITSSTAGYFFAVGAPTTDGTQVVNNFMMKSILKYDVTEQVKIIY